MSEVTTEAEVKMTPAEKAEQKFLQSTFKNQLTQDGLKELREKYPADLVTDMTDDENLKAARKTRTERNKLVEAIDRRRIDFTNDVKGYADQLIEEIKDIYDVVVIPFEKEDQRRKDEVARLKREHEEMLEGQRSTLASIAEYVDQAKASDSLDEISELIDAVGNVEADDFHKDIIHEVMAMLKQVNKDLSEIYMQKSSEQILRAEAAAAEAAAAAAAAAAKAAEEEAAAAKAEAEAKAAAIEAKQQLTNKISDRLNNLKMIPIDLMGESAKVIRSKIAALEIFEVKADEFLERQQEAIEAIAKVVSKLQIMLAQQEELEIFAAERKAKADAKAADDLAAMQAANPEPENINQDIEYPAQETQQEPTGRVNVRQRDPQEVLSSMKPASALVANPAVTAEDTLMGSLQAWAVHFDVPQHVNEALLETLHKYQVI